MPGIHEEVICVDETYTTIQNWETGRNGILSEVEKGKVKTGYAGDENISIGGSITTSDYYMWLTSEVDAEHDGRSNEVSSAGNARVEGSSNAGTLDIGDEYTRVDWMEFDCNISANSAFMSLAATTCTTHIHHNIIHNDHKGSGTSNMVLFFNDADITLYWYRNIMYGFGAGLWIYDCAAGTEVFNNTIFDNNECNDASRGGLQCDDANATLQNNAGFDSLQLDFNEDAGTWDYNCSGDASATGDHSLASKTDTDNLTNPTDTWANTDLTIKVGAVDIDAGAGVNSDTAGWNSLPEAAVPVSDRSDTSLQNTVLWSMGADHFPVSTGVVIFRRRRSA